MDGRKCFTTEGTFSGDVRGDKLVRARFQVTYNAPSQLFSPNEVEGIAGFVFIVIAIFYFIKAREKK